MSSSDQEESTSSSDQEESTSSSNSIEKKMIVLRSNEGDLFEVEESIAVKESKMIEHLIDSECDAPIVPLHNINAQELAKVIQYWNCRNDSFTSVKEKKRLESEFAMGLEGDELSAMIMAANYLDSPALMDIMCQAVADTIVNMTVEEVRDYFGMENDFTEEEEEELREENAWAFE